MINPKEDKAMINIATDWHKKTSNFHVVDECGKKLNSCRIVNSRQGLRDYVGSIPGPKRLAMEATRNWGLLYDTVHDLVDEFHLGHPKRMKAITESEIKNDKRDAETMARLLQSGFFPEAHITCSDTRQLRSVLRFRHFLVRQRRALRNQVHVLLDRNLFLDERPGTFKSVFCKRGLEWLRSVELPDRERFILNQCLESYAQIENQIAQAELYVLRQTVDAPGLKHLRTTPGFLVGKVNAFTVLLETDDINRFHKVRGYLHYSGLVPSEYSSADKHRNGKLVKANMNLRTAFIESALAAVRNDPGLKQYYLSVKKRSGSSDAIIATARKLATAVYFVLKEQRPYRPEPIKSPAAV
jgi:transposase